MTTPFRVFLSYAPEDEEAVAAVALRLRGDARLAFWFAPWHSIPGVPVQEQMEAALAGAQACLVFVGRAGAPVGWHNEQMRAAIQRRVEDDRTYRVIPVLLPGAASVKRQDLPPFLRRYELVAYQGGDDPLGFRRLLAGILGVPPIAVEDYLQAEAAAVRLAPPPEGYFKGGHALVIGIAGYAAVTPLADAVLNDARAVQRLLTDPAICGYRAANVRLLLDAQAGGTAIRQALADLAAAAGPDDTAVIFYSGHGARSVDPNHPAEYLLPYDYNPGDPAGTALAGDEMSALLDTIQAGRLLLLLDACHSGGLGSVKDGGGALKTGLSDDYYAALAQGRGRVVVASSRADEVSWVLSGMENSLFTHFLLEALQGQGPNAGDGYVRVFDVFRHVARQVPQRADQHPIFKASGLETDFPIALAGRHGGAGSRKQ